MEMPTDDELLTIAKEALQIELNDYYKANVEISAQNIAEGISPGGVNWNLALIKMMLLTSFRVRQIKAGGEHGG